jgi:SNF2-related domain
MRTRPDERGGGILADEMGMGKSLSILTLIVDTLEAGQEWANQQNENIDIGKQYSRSTLIVVSSARRSSRSLDNCGENKLTLLKFSSTIGQTKSESTTTLSLITITSLKG